MTSQASFLPERLIQLINSPQTVTSTYATSPQGTAIQAVAEKLYGKHHHHAPHSLSSDQTREHEAKDESSGGLSKILGRLHLKTSKETSDTKGTVDEEHVKKDKDVTNPAADQWAAMRWLDERELEGIRKCGNWGGSQPSDLFLNVCFESNVSSWAEIWTDIWL
jgi:hypothetical protein